MAESKTSRSRAWNFPTSPRSPYKLQGELKLLKAFDGRVWDKTTQLEFAKSLANYDGFEGNVSKQRLKYTLATLRQLRQFKKKRVISSLLELITL